MKFNFAVVIPMANEQEDFHPFVDSLNEVLTMLECGTVYFIVDKVSKDNTLELCNNLSKTDNRFITVWSPENKNVVDAYINGYKAALKNNHEI
ncbi:MAG TPA: glycosyltransferase, partial [Bacteroidia bacterium]|nr:glycosyltransferase [Bacteroidia bacterium]